MPLRVRYTVRPSCCASVALTQFPQIINAKYSAEAYFQGGENR